MINELNIDQIYKAIYNQYESVVYELPKRHQKSCLSLLNVATELYHNAQRLLRKQNSLITQNNQPLTLEQTHHILLDFYRVCSDTSPLILKLITLNDLLKNFDAKKIN